MSFRLLSLLAIAIAMTASAWAAAPADGHRVERPTDPVELVELRLEKGLFAGDYSEKKGIQDGQLHPVILHLYRRANGFTSGWGMAEALNGRGVNAGMERPSITLERPLSLETSGLRCEGNHITGTVTRWHIVNARPWDAEVWTIDARIAGTAVKGTYDCRRPVDLKSPGKQEDMSFSGAVTGRVVAGADLERVATANTLAEGADWPCWTGPHSNGQAIPYAGELVDRWEDARMVWKAEMNLVPGSPGQGHPGGGTRYDYNGPMVADGKVYFFTLEPVLDGPLLERKSGGRAQRADVEKQAQGKRQYRWIASLLVDDVGYCFDARTGARLWRTVFPRHGVTGNLVGKGKGGHWSTPIIADGRVYWCGTNSRVYCLDAATGEVLWQRVLIPEVVKRFEAGLKTIEDAGQTPTGFGQLNDLQWQWHVQTSPCLAGGVLVCPAKGHKADQGKAGLYGLDPATGKVRWGPIPQVQNYGSPIRWRHGDAEYVLTPDMRCLDPRTGKELWNRPQPGKRFCGAISKDGFYLARNQVHFGRGNDSVGAQVGPILKLEHDGAKPHASIPDHGSDCSLSAPGVGAACDEEGNFFYYLDPGTDRNAQGMKERENCGLYVVDRNGKPLASNLGSHFKHRHGYGSILYSNHRALVPGNAYGMGMFVWDPEKPELKYAGHLAINYYWCSAPSMADGRVFFRINDGIVCYDLRKQE